MLRALVIKVLEDLLLWSPSLPSLPPPPQVGAPHRTPEESACLTGLIEEVVAYLAG